jgi:hypothetical protein
LDLNFKGMRYHNHMNKYNGIVNYIQLHFPNLNLEEGLKASDYLKHYHSIIRKYLRLNNIEHKKFNRHCIAFKNASLAQTDWKHFTDYLKQENDEKN